jgi:predicted nucleic acid-binding protein
MKSNRLQKYESKIEPEASPEQIKQAREWMVNQVMEAYDRLPANIQPVVESFSELARQAKEGVPRESTLIISGDAEKTNEILPTKNNSGDAEKTNEILLTKYTAEEIAILESLKNGES